MKFSGLWLVVHLQFEFTGMRIDEHELASIDKDDLERMRPVYRHCL